MKIYGKYNENIMKITKILCKYYEKIILKLLEKMRKNEKNVKILLIFKKLLKL